jgi:hypothetical protein
MTRFKEKRRIDAAIAHGNRTELEWALSYCEMRLKLATMKHHQKHWCAIERRVRNALKKIEKKSIKEAPE